MVDKTPRGFANIAAPTDALQIGVAKEWKTGELRPVQYDKSFKKNVAYVRDCRTSDFNRNSQYSQDTDRPPVSIDENNSTNDFLTTERETWQDGSNVLIPNEPRFISRTDGMSVNMA